MLTMTDRSPMPEGWPTLELWQRRAIKTVVAVVALVFVSSLVYHYLLTVVEGRTETYAHSFQVVVETYTGTGYGSDSPWNSTILNAFVSVMDLSTFLILFIVFPYVFQPVLEEALAPSLPTRTDRSGHVVVCGVEQQGERLVDELEARNAEYVVIAREESTALQLQERGWSVLHGDPSSAETLKRASLEDARAVVVDTADSKSASVVLAVRAVDDAIRSIVLVEDMEFERYLEYAGADQVLTPRHLLGQRIAERISREISPVLTDSIRLGQDVSLLELTVFEDSPIHGETLSTVETQTDDRISVVGVWQDGTFDGFPASDFVIDSDMSLLVAGEESALRELESETYVDRTAGGEVVIAGYGMVGSTVQNRLGVTDSECTVIDIEEKPGVDIVGDATDEETLRQAGIEDATAFVVTIADDDLAILSVLVARQLVTDCDVMARVNDADNDRKIRRAGADYVLSLPEISGRLLALEVLGEEILSYDRQLKVVRIDAGRFSGETLEATRITDNQCAVVAVERDADLLTDVAPTFELHPNDDLIVVGSDEGIDAIQQ